MKRLVRRRSKAGEYCRDARGIAHLGVDHQGARLIGRDPEGHGPSVWVVGIEDDEQSIAAALHASNLRGRVAFRRDRIRWVWIGLLAQAREDLIAELGIVSGDKAQRRVERVAGVLRSSQGGKDQLPGVVFYAERERIGRDANASALAADRVYG